MCRQIALISSERSHLWSCTERGISLFVCLVAGKKIVEIVGLQPCWAVVSPAALFTFFPQKTLALMLCYVLRSVLFFIDSSIKKKTQQTYFKFIGKCAVFVCQRVNGVEVADKLPA